MAAEAEEDELSMAFRGGVTLTFREDAKITLTPEQVRLLPCGLCMGCLTMSN